MIEYMSEIIKIETIDQYNKLRGIKTLHPLISVMDLSQLAAMPSHTFNFGFYAIYLKELICGEIKYGRNKYDFQEGTLVFTAPGQIVSVQPNLQIPEAKGWALLFHPDLIKGTSLGKHIQDYSFFSYDVHEALHLSDSEKQLLTDSILKIHQEMQQSIDKHSKTLMVSNLELFLNYCTRFYDRQFITRDHDHKGIIEKFEQILHTYFSTDKPQNIGLPTVAYCAEALNLSANYFGDLIKKESAITAQEYIHTIIMDVAKERLFNMDYSISEIAYKLGFKYPQHFSRLFKQKVGLSPNEYRRIN